MLAVTALGIAVGYAVWHTSVGRGLELSTVDGRFQVRGSQRPWPGVVIVGIDPDTLYAYGRFPFARSHHADMIDRLRADGARVIAYDVVFDAPTAPEQDLLLYDAAKRAHGRLVLAGIATDKYGNTLVLGGTANLRAAGVSVGSANFPVASDGAVRRVPETVERLRSFAVASALTAGLPASRLRGLFDGGSQWINFPGPAGTVKSYSFVDVINGRVPASAFRGRIVVVGTVANDLHDYATVGGWPSQPMQGAEIEADAISTLMRGAPLRSLATPLEWLELVLAALILPALALLRVHWPRLILAGVLVAAAVLLAAQLAFDSGVVTMVVAPLAALLVGGAGAVLIPLVIERRELRVLRERFARFDPAVVGAVLANTGMALRVRAMAIGPESVIAGYRLVSLVGRGGMGVVYESEQLTLGRPVALKLIDPAHADDDEFRARFVRESHVAAALEHPHVIPVYEAREDAGLLFIAMQLVRGPSLAEMLATAAPLEAAQAARLVAQVASALGAAHARGLVHRDVKPANVLLHGGDHAYLTDFGVTREISGDGGLTGVGERVGTVDYMAPEQCRGEAVAPAADIYALGCMLYEALTGAVPFPGQSEATRMAAHLHDPPPVASERWPSVPVTLDAVILTAMAKEPGKRFLSAELFAAAVLRGVGIEPAEAAAATPTRAPLRADQATLASP